MTNAYVDDASVVPSLSVADVSVKLVAELEIAEARVVSKNAIVVGIACEAPSVGSSTWVCGTKNEPMDDPTKRNGVRSVTTVCMRKFIIIS